LCGPEQFVSQPPSAPEHAGDHPGRESIGAFDRDGLVLLRVKRPADAIDRLRAGGSEREDEQAFATTRS
jgi:hypothetical protein